jgi:hypothetical protein
MMQGCIVVVAQRAQDSAGIAVRGGIQRLL